MSNPNSLMISELEKLMENIKTTYISEKNSASSSKKKNINISDILQNMPEEYTQSSFRNDVIIKIYQFFKINTFKNPSNLIDYVYIADNILKIIMFKFIPNNMDIQYNLIFAYILYIYMIFIYKNNREGKEDYKKIMEQDTFKYCILKHHIYYLNDKIKDSPYVFLTNPKPDLKYMFNKNNNTNRNKNNDIDKKVCSKINDYDKYDKTKNELITMYSDITKIHNIFQNINDPNIIETFKNTMKNVKLFDENKTGKDGTQYTLYGFMLSYTTMGIDINEFNFRNDKNKGTNYSNFITTTETFISNKNEYNSAEIKLLFILLCVIYNTVLRNGQLSNNFSTLYPKLLNIVSPYFFIPYFMKSLANNTQKKGYNVANSLTDRKPHEKQTNNNQNTQKPITNTQKTIVNIQGALNELSRTNEQLQIVKYMIYMVNNNTIIDKENFKKNYLEVVDLDYGLNSAIKILKSIKTIHNDIRYYTFIVKAIHKILMNMKDIDENTQNILKRLIRLEPKYIKYNPKLIVVYSKVIDGRRVTFKIQTPKIIKPKVIKKKLKK